MESNISDKNITFISNLVCNIGSFLYLHLTKTEKSYLLLCAEPQSVLTLIINILALVSVKETKQWQRSSLKETRLLSAFHLITTLFATSMMLTFTYLHIKDYRISTFLLSILLYLLELNKELICFVSFNRFLHANLYQTFQQKSKSNISNVPLVMDILWSLYEFIWTNINRFISVPFVIDIISLIISVKVIIL